MASIWKFDRIMVATRNIRLDRSEFPDAEIDCSLPKQYVVVFDIFGERQLGPRKHADRYGGRIFGCETASRSPAKSGGN